VIGLFDWSYEEPPVFVPLACYDQWVKKILSTVPHEECWWGAHLPYLSLEPVGG